MSMSMGVQVGAHTVTSTEGSGNTCTFTVNMVKPQSFQLLISRSGAIVSGAGAVVTLTAGTETSGVWSNATLTVAGGGGYTLTAADVIYWLVG